MLGNRVGSVSVIASGVMAAAGLALGGVASYFTGLKVGSSASYYYTGAFDLRDAPLTGGGGGEVFAERERVIRRMLADHAPERFAPPELIAAGPRIIVVFDDMGLDEAAFEEIMRLPGPVTLSFLPYAKNVQPLADEARERGDAVMLHLPMEPAGAADPGPHALKTGMSASSLLGELQWNLDRFDGYIAVNNHMGSALTRDEASMKTILSVLNEKGVFFLDSLTTGDSVAAEAGRDVGERVYVRDVFLDPDMGRETVMKQLALAERIARETGFVVAICHPRRDTLDIVGPWLASAPARGFKLDTIAALPTIESAWKQRRRMAARK